MRTIALLFLLQGSLLLAQSAGEKAQTSGACSPAVVGSNNHITMTCGGISKAKADELVRLMNGILARQIDPKAVYDQLDQIQRELDAFRNVMSDPMAQAAPADMDTWHKAQQMQQECQRFLTQWNDDLIQGNQDYAQQQLQAVRSRSGMPDPPMNRINQQRSEAFKKELSPQLVSLRDQMVPKVPSYSAAGLDYTALTSNRQAMNICSDFGRLTVNYQVALYQDSTRKQMSK